jgi:cytochrome P450
MRPPILYLEGDQHRLQRRAAARFFAPAVIEGYRPMMESLAGELVSRLRADRSTDLTRLSMRMAVGVAAQVIGLTNSSTAAMSRRLAGFFGGDPLAEGRGPIASARMLLTGGRTARFYRADVRPAIRARRATREQDIISQLIDIGFTDLEIFTECVTYAAAGMATTRELINVAAWHLIDDPALLDRFRSGDLADRRGLLEELLRVEPVTVPAGSALDVRLRVVNEDPAIVGDDGARVCPGRSLPRAVPAVVMSFGDGHHRCPGGPLAIMESEIFLSRLFARDLVADGPPRVRWNAVSHGYDLDRYRVRLAGRRR